MLEGSVASKRYGGLSGKRMMPPGGDGGGGGGGGAGAGGGGGGCCGGGGGGGGAAGEREGRSERVREADRAALRLALDDDEEEREEVRALDVVAEADPAGAALVEADCCRLEAVPVAEEDLDGLADGDDERLAVAAGEAAPVEEDDGDAPFDRDEEGLAAREPERELDVPLDREEEGLAAREPEREGDAPSDNEPESDPEPELEVVSVSLVVVEPESEADPVGMPLLLLLFLLVVELLSVLLFDGLFVSDPEEEGETEPVVVILGVLVTVLEGVGFGQYRSTRLSPDEGTSSENEKSLSKNRY